MRNACRAMIALALLLTSGSRLLADIVSEGELVTLAQNNTILTSQSILSSSFTLPVPAGVFNPPGWATATIQGYNGGHDVDFYAFTTGAGSAMFDIDGAYPGFDSLVSLFNSSGVLIAQDDDSSPADSGSSSTWDSFLGTISLSAGTYYVAVSISGNDPVTIHSAVKSTAHFARPDGGDGGYSVSGATADDTFDDGNTSAGTSKSYTLNISLSAVPEPSSLVLLALATAGIAAYAHSRRKRD